MCPVCRNSIISSLWLELGHVEWWCGDDQMQSQLTVMELQDHKIFFKPSAVAVCEREKWFHVNNAFMEGKDKGEKNILHFE